MSDELKNCRACGAPCRVEHFHATPYRSDQNIWLCSRHKMFGGDCPSDIAYLFEDAWNTRAPSSNEALLREAQRLLKRYVEPNGRHEVHVRGRELLAKIDAALNTVDEPPSNP